MEASRLLQGCVALSLQRRSASWWGVLPAAEWGDRQVVPRWLASAGVHAALESPFPKRGCPAGTADLPCPSLQDARRKSTTHAPDTAGSKLPSDFPFAHADADETVGDLHT